MSKAGCPYDNAPMERYYNTLKNEEINLHYYHSENELDQAVHDFAYIWYNHVRPHSYNNNMTPFEAGLDVKKVDSSVTTMLDHYTNPHKGTETVRIRSIMGISI